MAIPGETPMPLSLCSLAMAVPGVSSVLIKLAFDQPRQRFDRCRGVGSGRGNLDAGDDLHLAPIHDRDRQVGGGAAKHVGQQYRAVAAVDLADALKNFLTALFHIVIGADADRGDLALGPDHVLEGCDKFRCQPPMSDQHHTDHRNPFARPRPLPFADTSARPDDRRAGACARRAADSPGAGGETADQARKHEIDASTQGRGRSLLMPGAWGAGPAGAWEYCGGWI